MRRYSWDQITRRFQGEWIELVEFDWDWNSPFPKWARVRHHSTNKRELQELIHGSSAVEDAVTLFVGPLNLVVDHTESSVVI